MIDLHEIIDALKRARKQICHLCALGVPIEDDQYTVGNGHHHGEDIDGKPIGMIECNAEYITRILRRLEYKKPDDKIVQDL